MKYSRIKEGLKERRAEHARAVASSKYGGSAITRPGSLNQKRTGRVQETGGYNKRARARKRSEAAIRARASK